MLDVSQVPGDASTGLVASITGSINGVLMSQASISFEEFIQDAENLLNHFNTLNSQPPSPDIEVLKRAGLVMAMTAWESSVEDRLQEASAELLRNLNNDPIARFIKRKLDLEIKQLNNPRSAKTIELFKEYAFVDLASAWSWNNFEPKVVKETLDDYLTLRGQVVHRSRLMGDNGSNAHPVKKGDLQKVIRFLKSLVEATEKAFET